MRFITSLFAMGTALLSATAAAAQDLPVIGQPVPQGIGFQPAATELMRDVVWLDNFLLVIITVITVFVTALLLWCIARYGQKRNPTPATFTHNAPLEVGWTLGPVVILVLIGVFSLPVLFKQQEIPVADVTIKAMGHQWYWSYDYVDAPVRPADYVDEATTPSTPLLFESHMIGAPVTGGANRLTPEVEAMLTDAGYTRDQWLLATTTSVVVPVDKVVVMNVTGMDVIHSWKVPAFGVMQDAVPGRTAQLWFRAEQEGVYFGQCSELCGQMHAYMPITVKVVSQPVYDEWLAANQERIAADGFLDASNFVEPEDVMVADAGTAAPVQVAANE
jgi:cytochrome c oxidase subunit II